ncbi:hypothetical protein KII97_02465 [Leuconostoc gelidum subsp. gasicomitatum]|uniref:hypothetical protein n=1 Tax=Leuconostoc gasicomitatum TaxID=115778 RepID=UPI001CC79A31|nr:hypothetical protein [Leuconostoc gasicomitatum]MBZ5995371.1 hypothetical protein [Leuconostoc gasicomitatum]
MAKYRKKPVVVEAWQAYDDFDLDDKLPVWVNNAFIDRIIGETYQSIYKYYVNTLEGNMYFKNGDYLIKGVRGELYAVKADIFEETYEEVK